MSRALAALVVATLLAGCGYVRRIGEGRAESPSAQDEEAPDAPEERGVKHAPGHPRAPATPEALLAEGAVGEIQDALVERGLLGEHRRGELDDATSRAIRRFQAEEGLAETGMPDRETLSRLGVDPKKAYGRAEDDERAERR